MATKTTAKTGGVQAPNQRPGASMGEQQTRASTAVDDSKAHSCYSPSAIISATAEEIVVDFVGSTKPGRGPNNSDLVMVESRVTMSPWAAKRLATKLVKVIASYEESFGVLEIDARKRTVTPAKS